MENNVFRISYPSLVIIDSRMFLGGLLRFFFEQNQLFEKIDVISNIEALEHWRISSLPPTLFLISGSNARFFEEMAHYVRLHYPDTPIIFVDRAVRYASIHVAIEEKVNCYWTAHDSLEEFANVVHNVIHGKRIHTPRAGEVVRVDRNHLKMLPDCPYYGLSKREKELLSLLGQKFSLEECGKRMELTKKSVDNLKTRLMAKLEVHSITDLIHFAAEFGLMEH